jgi:quinoprotein glucose dehydrogenase
MVSNGLVPGDPKRSEFAWISGSAAARGEAPALRVQGLPLVKPPYGSIVAIDMDKGDILWKIANAETPDNVRNHPALKGLNIPRTGRQSNTIGILLTKTLMIAGEPGTFTLPDGRNGAMLRAYDKPSGKEVGAVYMPAGQTGTPMTYMLNGKQYIVVAIAGQTYPAELVAFKLPN